MSDIRDFFIKTLDEAESGINRMMLKLMEKIKLVDPDVEEQLIAQEIKPQYFSFRYIKEPRPKGRFINAHICKIQTDPVATRTCLNILT